jgi:hypothetical protein
MTHSSLPINTTDLNSFTDKSFSLLHSKQKESLANAVSGVLVANSLIPSKIGEGLAELKGRHPKHTKERARNNSYNFKSPNILFFSASPCKISFILN